jgi:rhodanese-related sulfurtransferase
MMVNGAFAYENMTPVEARAAVVAGQAVLIDIRRPDEWSATGIAASAKPIDMRKRDFGQRLKAIIDQNPGKRIALICHSGVRSANLAAQLEAADHKGIVNVVGGMAGSGDEPGWVARGLPLAK